MVAHLDSVTSLAVDQHGLYLISGSHDCSIRLLGQGNNYLPQNIQKIASSGLVWSTNNIPALITPLSPSYIGNSQAVEP